MNDDSFRRVLVNGSIAMTDGCSTIYEKDVTDVSQKQV